MTVPEALADFFRAHPRAALAFSGGTDSAYLLWAAVRCGCQVTAFYVQSPFQPAFEREDARRLAAELGAPLRIIPVNTLAEEAIRLNPPERCYHCKRAIFSALTEAARGEGCPVMLDGTNASDDAGDRPGMRALAELGVLSPLRACGITKAMVRSLSREAGLFTWNKPAYACLATRIPTGTPLTPQALERVESAETALRDLGFSDLRVRVMGSAARLQLPAGQMALAVAQRDAIKAALRPWFDPILLDLEDRG